PLAARQRLGEQDVGAKRRLEFVLLRQAIGRLDAAQHFLKLEPLLRPWGERLAQLLGQWLGAQPDALLGHESRCRLVHEQTVFDALDAGGNRALYRDWGVGMDGDIRSPVLCGFNRGAKFLFGERGDIQRAMW